MSKAKNHLEAASENHFTSTVFNHDWITYDSKENKVTLSDEAMWELQKLIDTIQAGFPIEEKNPEPVIESMSVEKITETTVVNFTDAMIVAGKWDKAIGRFLARAKILLQWKKKKWKLEKIEKKVEKKTAKYKDSFFAHIVLQYTEWWEKKSLQEAPIIVRPWEKLSIIIHSLQIRLRFTHNQIKIK